MEVVSQIPKLRAWNNNHRSRSRALVPTMGALHRGHTSLFDIARESAGPDGDVVATIFVNPTQFGPNEDFDAYPRQMKQDLDKCEAHGVDLVFTPEAASMYEGDASISIHEDAVSSSLCGSSRPGHFDGVCTVVAKLFNLTQPDAAVFGEKDFQQLAVIRRMVRDLDFPIKIIPGPTVREEDGLALSSRNAYLTPAEREQAPIIRKALLAAISGIADGGFGTVEEALLFARQTIEMASLAEIDYLEAFHHTSLIPLSGPVEEKAEVRIATAVFFGKTRLIDNIGIS